MEAQLSYAVLNTLSYFQVFQYPLSGKEICKYLSVKCSEQMLGPVLTDLVAEKVIYKIEDYYCLHDNPALIARRKRGNQMGREKLQKALRIARFLGLFPFVETVCISGSLSKDFALHDSDLDFFVITAPGRLWTARNFMHLFRKMSFLLNVQSHFCMNYYVSMHEPEISPKNLFTAIELATLKPGWMHDGLDQFYCVNKHWVYNCLPNITLGGSNTRSKKSIMTKTLERLINFAGGNKIEAIFYKTTMNRWTKKWRRKGYDVEQCMLSAGLHFNTPQNYPVNMPEAIMNKHNQLYREALVRFIPVINKEATLPA